MLSFDFVLQIMNAQTMLFLQGERLRPELVSHLADLVCTQYDVCRNIEAHRHAMHEICPDPLGTIISSMNELLKLLPPHDGLAQGLAFRLLHARQPQLVS